NFGGADGIRTHDLLDAIEARSNCATAPPMQNQRPSRFHWDASQTASRPHWDEELKRFYISGMVASISPWYFGAGQCLVLGGRLRRGRPKMSQKGVLRARQGPAAEDDGANGS